MYLIFYELCHLCLPVTLVVSGASENCPSIVHDKDAKGPVGIPSLPAIQKKPAVATKPTTSGSSRDQSDDDEAEGETDMIENMDPSDVKRVRRYHGLGCLI